MTTMLLPRAVLAIVVMPGVVAFLLPWLIAGGRSAAPSFDLLGLIALIPGTALLLWCAAAFYLQGRGTLAPWDPPQELVVTGVYRWSRNPMYVGVVLVLWGWVLGFRSRPLAVYALAVMAAFQLRVALGEEPWLAEQHGAAWRAYREQVPRWFGIRRFSRRWRRRR